MRAQRARLPKTKKTKRSSGPGSGLQRVIVVAILFCCILPCSSRAQQFRGKAGSVSDLLAMTPIQPNDELRALWVVRYDFVSREEIDRLVDIAVRARFHVIFAQVHAWVNILYVWSDGRAAPPENHVIRLHPDWILTDDRGRRMDEFPVEYWTERGFEGYYLSPALREVREYTASVIEDLAGKYPIDGVHLDYIRYPGKLFGYGEYERTDFALRCGVDPLLLLDDRPRITNVIGETGAMSLDAQLAEWRVQQIDSLVAAIRQAVPGLTLSAAVVSDLDQARQKGQDWAGWVQNGLVDFAVLMAYGYRPEPLQRHIQHLKNVMSTDRFVVGLPLFDGRAQYLERSVSLLREEGVSGYSLFSYKQLADNPFSVGFLGQVFFGEPEEEAEEGTEDQPADE
ncbi:MAG: family 10 glycosylhydrolase [Chitinivibrionia bacterium]|nr:family 10 glycosylhydrolase [Chitinivibrionia bacterium]